MDLFTSLFILSYPIRQVTTFVFSKLTRRKYAILNIDLLVELGFTSCVIVWLYQYNNSDSIETLSEKYTDRYTLNQIFILNTIEDIQDGKFRLDFLLAF